MRGNLPKREPDIIRRWNENELYQRMQEHRRNAPLFVLHDGPPYANGNIHIGHTLNKVLKDFIVRFRTMAGWRAPYVPGWDCHGLPIELQVEKNLGGKHDHSKAKFRGLCRKYAERFIAIQREEFRRLGILGDWDRPYLTLDPAYEAQEVRELGRFFEQGAVYRGRKPVIWCASCETALAEAEVEYEQYSSPSIYVAFALQEPLPEVLARFCDRPIDVVIWTTTPWTLLANLAIAVHPDLEYVLVEAGSHRWIVAQGLLERFLVAVQPPEHQVLTSFPGSTLENARARHPWIERDSLLVLGEHITLEAGTGCVHTAPGHGQEDYEVGLRYGLDVYAPVDHQGRFLREVERFGGEHVFDADAGIITLLRESGRLLQAARFEHSYPHCWRCKNPILYRATDQWFVAMDTTGLRQRALEEIDRVRWIPGWGRDRIFGMMESRPDWCISRQRNWGVPIVAFYCKQCGKVLANREIAERVASIFETEGSDAWFLHPSAKLMPPGTRCPDCQGEEFRKEEDILDVWFDSGVSHAAVLESREELRSPADLYLEGSDQHRGWFHTSMLTSVLTRDRAPYEAVLTHGFTIDASGRKMSKSLGNVVAPQEIIEKFGAEILRLWVAAEDYRADVRLPDPEITRQLAESYRRIRNTARFLIANLYDFVPSDAVAGEDLEEIDRWVIDRTRRLAGRCRAAYLDYEFHVVYHALNNFCSVDLSSVYLDVVKDRLYCTLPRSTARRSAQTAIHMVLDTLVRVMAPVLAFTAEEIWQHVPIEGERALSPMLLDFPDDGATDDSLAASWDRLLEVRGAVTRALEELRQEGEIGHSLDACVTLRIRPGGDLAALLLPRRDALAALFIVSGVELVEDPDASGSELEGLGVAGTRAAGEKCARCWNYRISVGEAPAHPLVCGPCAQVLQG